MNLTHRPAGGAASKDGTPIQPPAISRALTVTLAYDHAILATCTLGKCKPYEMISSALWSLELDGRVVGKLLRPVVDVALYLFTGPNHCKQSYDWQIHLYKDNK